MKGRSFASAVRDREWQRTEARKATATRDRVLTILVTEGRDAAELARATGMTIEEVIEIASR